MAEEQKYSIELTEYEIELFKKFREWQDDLELLNDSHFFIFKNGSMEIHRDDKGKIRKIEEHLIPFKS